MRYAIGILASIVALVASAGEAGATHWQSVAAGCVLDPVYASKAEVSPLYGWISFKAGQTGTIKFVCPVTAWTERPPWGDANPNTFSITYVDPDGAGAGYGVSTNVLANRSDGDGWTNVAGIASNSYPHTSKALVSVGFSHAWDEYARYYWVTVEMYRGSTAANVYVSGVQIWSDQIP